MKPRLAIGKRSTYTVLGFAGYAVATIVGVVLAMRWELDVVERAIALVGPPLAFLITVTVAKRIKGHEWIVFYQSLLAAVGFVVGLGLATDSRVWRLVDITVIGVGTFLLFGRLGCFHVACCHGRVARRGVVYGEAHAAAGFWGRLVGRPLLPVQLIEGATSAMLVGIAIAVSSEPGRAALTYVTGYACARFLLELVRGDLVRPYALGLSEAQWSSMLVLAVCAIAWPAWWTLGAFASFALVAAVLAARRRARELYLPPHLRELDRTLVRAMAEKQRHETSLGVAVSCADLPDGRRDWILSSERADWSVASATRLAHVIWPRFEIVPGRTPGVVHVIES